MSEDGQSGSSRDPRVRMVDGTPLSGERLQELVDQARAEAWEVLSPRTAAPAAPPPGVNRYEAAMDALLDRAHLAGSHEVPALIGEHAAALGASGAVIYLADLQQSTLVPFLSPGTAIAPTALPVDTTLAGRVFQRLKVLDQPLPGDAGGRRVWLPLLDGTERLGALSVDLPSSAFAVSGHDLAQHRAQHRAEHTGRHEDLAREQLHTGALGRRLRRLAAVAAELVVTKTLYGDTIVRLRRQAPLGLAAELQWSQLPPLTFASRQVVIAAALEPAYDVAGDAVDYAVDDGWARFAIFDGMGHGLQSAHLSVLAVAAYRNARRAGRSLIDTAHAIDDAVHDFSPGVAYCSGLLAELDTTTGRLSWVNAGHPEPLVLRAGKLATSLHLDPGHPFGLGLTSDAEPGYTTGTITLQPDDRVVLYTDGVTDARCLDGNPFGLDRLVDLLTRTDDPHLPPPETMRRVVRALLEHQQDHLVDDATLLAVDWPRNEPDDFVPR